MSIQLDDTWNVIVKIPTGEEKSVVKLKSDGETVTGTMDNEKYGVQEIFDGKLEGDQVTWKSKTTKPMPLTLTYTATLDESKNMEGTVKVAMAKMKFTGTLA